MIYSLTIVSVQEKGDSHMSANFIVFRT